MKRIHLSRISFLHIVTPNNTRRLCHNILNLGVLVGILLAFASCGQSDSQQESSIKRDHEQISALLDRALLGEAPIDSFRVALDKVRAYPSVDSAWIAGSSLFVRYKQGGIVSWTIPPDQRIK